MHELLLKSIIQFESISTIQSATRVYVDIVVRCQARVDSLIVCLTAFHHYRRFCERQRDAGRRGTRRPGRYASVYQDAAAVVCRLDVPRRRRIRPGYLSVQRTHRTVWLRAAVPQRVDADEVDRSHGNSGLPDRLARSL